MAKNAILLIDFAKWSEEAGMERREALIQAGRVRLRPILMTTFALVAGMVPVALGGGEGGDFRAPLGIAVIGGVITSTLLTLLVIPDGLRDRWPTRATGWSRSSSGAKPRTGPRAGAPRAGGRASLTDAETSPMHNPFVPETLEGWSLLHLMYRVRWDRLRARPPSRPQRLADEAMRALAVPDAGATALVQMLGHKADLMFICFRRGFEAAGAGAAGAVAHRAARRISSRPRRTSRSSSSGMYEMTAKIHEQLGAKHKPGSEEFEQAFDARDGDAAAARA